MRTHQLLTGLSILGLFSFTSAISRPAKRSYSTHDYYVLEHDPTFGIPVEDCARALGAEVVEPAGELRDHWLLRVEKDLDSGPTGNDRLWGTLHGLRLGLAGASDARASRKRDLVPFAVKHVQKQMPRQRMKRAAVPAPPPPLPDDTAHSLSREIAQRLGITDPLFQDQWHLVNEEYPEHMVNATPVWDMGIAGEGIISAMVDDGLDYESEDIADNFYAAGSHDFNDHEDLPKPKLWDDHHGTRCAGQIAAVKNGVCGVGIAYKSKVAGVRILSGPITDVDEAAALNFAYQDTSIYSCSWGPSDDGMSMEAPNFLIQKAMLNGVQNGRGGRGSVFVFASGNGGYSGDQCNFDGYTNSIYSVTVAAIDYQGKHPYYSEECAANMIVTYSSGSNAKKQIVTTDVGKNKCTEGHGGTSAAAPNAVGIFALALSVRPDLTWRDIQHLCYQTARIVNPGDHEDWEVTAAGRPYSYKYGYGKLDAYDFVAAAKDWKLVKPQAWVEIPAIQLGGGRMDEDGKFEGGARIGEDGVTSDVEITWQMLENNNFDALEHVTITVWIQHSRRGDVEVQLISPHGVKSMLAGKRKLDKDRNGFQGWRFMTVKHWAENPLGKWTIKVSDQDRDGESGHFIGWRISLWGSANEVSRATPYVLKSTEDVPFPPPEPTHTPEPTTTAASTTKSYQKPTIVTTHASTESSKPGQEDIASTTVANDESQPTSGSGSGKYGENEAMSEFTRFWIGIVGYGSSVAILGGAIYLIVRQIRRRRRQTDYARVPDTENVRMTSIDNARVSGSGRERHADVVYDEDEEKALTTETVHGHAISSGPVGFHSGFLDDDEAATSAAPLYRDTPSEEQQRREAGPSSSPTRG